MKNVDRWAMNADNILVPNKSGRWCLYDEAAREKEHVKFPTLLEVQVDVQSRMWYSGFTGTSFSITEAVYDFIKSKLRNQIDIS